MPPRASRGIRFHQLATVPDLLCLFGPTSTVRSDDASLYVRACEEDRSWRRCTLWYCTIIDLLGRMVTAMAAGVNTTNPEPLAADRASLTSKRGVWALFPRSDRAHL